MLVKDLSGARAQLGIAIVASPAAEMLTSLYFFLDEHLHLDQEVGKEWLDGVRSALSPELHAELRASSLGLGKHCTYLWPLPGESAAEEGCEHFLNRLAGVDPMRLRLALLGEWQRLVTAPEAAGLLERAARGEGSALDTCVALCGECEEVSAPQLRVFLSRDPEDDKEQLLSLLRGWYEQVFKAQEARLAPILARDAAAKRRLAARLTPLRQIEVVTSGLQYTPEPGITRVLLLPSMACRPWVLMRIQGETKVFIYSVAEESLSAHAEPAGARVLTLAKALSDERRLQALQILATRGATLQELADALGVGKSLMHHHMVTLRAAGLVRVQLGGDRHYQLREETLASLPGLLHGLLARRDEESAPPPTA